MPLLEAGQPVEDAWVTVADDAPIPDAPAIIAVHRLAELAPGRNTPIGVRLPSTTPVGELKAIADTAALIAIEFPTFRDGRGFTLARTLRERHSYTGEIRAVGHILPDQYEFLTRCGFTTVETKDDNPKPWQTALKRFSLKYQSAPGDQEPALLKHRQG
jgi:uncharacterized protein (DUF934 family)